MSQAQEHKGILRSPNLKGRDLDPELDNRKIIYITLKFEPKRQKKTDMGNITLNASRFFAHDLLVWNPVIFSVTGFLLWASSLVACNFCFQ